MNLDAERATLGAILLNRDAVLAVAGWLQPEHFWLPKHAAIFTAAIELVQGGTPPDARTLADALGRRGQLTEVGGVLYLAGLVDATPSSYHIEHYAREVQRTARLRAIIRAGEQIASLGMQPGADADTAEAQALTVVNTLIQQRSDEAVEHVALTVEDVITQMGRDESPCIPTGFRDLDHLLGGLFPEDFLILAARPSVGKTALALSILHQVAKRGVACLMFSLEMGRQQLVQRLAAQECGIDVQLLRQRLIPREKQAEFATAMRRLSALPIFTCDYAGLTPATLRAHVMRHLADYPQTVVIIDYLQLMEDKRREGRQQEVSDISRSLKRLARDAKVPVLALAQLNRAVEGRASKVPTLADLRESGSLEQDADVVMFIYREELYDQETEKKGLAELHIAKHRNGPLGVIPLRFDPYTTRFQSVTFREATGY